MHDEIVEHIEQSEVQSNEEIQQHVEQQIKKDTSEQNMRSLREAKERAERERDEAIRIAKQYEQQSNDNQDDTEINIGQDDLVEGKHLSKVDKKIKRLEEQLRSYQQKSAEITVESRLKAQYPDFDKVVCAENISALTTAYPEIANTLGSSTDLYNKAVSAYTMIKKLGIYHDDVYQNDRQRAQVNSSKPKPLASVSPQQGESPLTRANAFAEGLTEDLKTQLYKEMIESRRNY